MNEGCLEITWQDLENIEYKKQGKRYHFLEQYEERR